MNSAIVDIRNLEQNYEALPALQQFNIPLPAAVRSADLQINAIGTNGATAELKYFLSFVPTEQVGTLIGGNPLCAAQRGELTKVPYYVFRRLFQISVVADAVSRHIAEADADADFDQVRI